MSINDGLNRSPLAIHVGTIARKVFLFSITLYFIVWHMEQYLSAVTVTRVYTDVHVVVPLTHVESRHITSPMYHSATNTAVIVYNTCYKLI